MAVGQSLRASLASITPTWLANVPGFRTLYSVAYVIALLGDCLREIAWEGQLAAYPGVGTPTAVEYMAPSRALIQGPAEPYETFVARLLAFRQTHDIDGSPQGLAAMIQAYLYQIGDLGTGVYPLVEVVDRAGHVALAIDDLGTLEVIHETRAWDWDESGGWVDGVGYHPPAVIDTWWADFWIIIQDPFVHYTSFSDPNWLAAWNSGDFTLDSLCPQQVVQDLTGIIGATKGLHMFDRCVIWTTNDTFAPTGLYGNASHNVNGVQAAQRIATNSYWDLCGN